MASEVVGPVPGFHAFSFFLGDGSPCVDLQDSSAKCELDVVKFLLEKRADVNAPDSK